MIDWKTIECYVAGRNNNYLLIRFVAASLVIFSHSYHLSGNFGTEPLFRQIQFIDFSAIAVAIFFVASGFLISQSFDSRRNIFAFLEARILRIFPGLILAVLFTVFIVGTWATTLPLAEYFKNPETMKYVFDNIRLKTQYTLPGVFHGTPFPDGVNGALWTLRLEFYMYLMVAVIGMLGFFKSRLLLNLLVIFFFFVFLWNSTTLFFIPAEWALSHLKLFGCFVLGLIAYVNRAYIPLNFSVGAGLIGLTITGHGTPWFMYSFYVSLAYLTLLLAYHPSLRVDQFKRIGDYSYGLYIFGFPVQQSLVYLLGKPDPLLLFGLAFPLTLSLAILSWHFIERPSLNLKGKLTQKFYRSRSTTGTSPHLRGAEEMFDAQMPLDPFGKQFRLPAQLVERADRGGQKG